MQLMNNVAMAVGYLVMALIAIWLLWYAVSGVRRYHARSGIRAHARERARIAAAPPALLDAGDYGEDVHLGV